MYIYISLYPEKSNDSDSVGRRGLLISQETDHVWVIADTDIPSENSGKI